MNFVDKMVHLGFTESGRWEDDQDTLTRCVVRYHHFLDLMHMATTSGKFAVPTLVRDKGRTRFAPTVSDLLTLCRSRISIWHGTRISFSVIPSELTSYVFGLAAW